MATEVTLDRSVRIQDDIKILRQSALPLAAVPLCLIGWGWLVYVLVAMGGQVDVLWALPPAAIFVSGILALGLQQQAITAAATCLLIGLALCSFAASLRSFDGLAPYSFVLLVSVAGVLLHPYVGLVVAIPAVLMIGLAGRFGLSAPVNWAQIAQPSVLVGAAAVISFLSARNLYHAVGWAWENATLARQRLEEARDHQQVLNRTLHSLDDMYELVQRAQREEAIARQKAEEGQRLKAQFAATVSHELRTPLNAILGFAEVMHTAPEVYGDVAWPPALRSDVNEIYRNALHLQKLIDDILDLAQIDAMRMPLMAEDVHLADLIRDTVSAASGLVRSRDVQLVLDIAPNLPVVHADPTRIRQVLLNLLSNACRFTEHGHIVASATLASDAVRISVSDTGIGMTPEQLARVFREFEQADTSLRRRYGGTGLGLAISKRFVELHGGRIWAESTVGVGTTVHFSLPVQSRMEPAVEEMLAGRAGAAEEKSAAKTIVFQGKPDAGQRLISRYTGCESLLSSQTQETMALVTAEHPWAVVVAAESPAEADQVAALLDATPGHAAPVISYAVDGSATLAEHETVRWLAKPVRRRSLLASLAQVAPQACTILIVDDNPADVQLLSRMLRTAQKEYIVREAFGGGSAIQEMSAQPPDLVLLDLIMPDMNGLQVVEWMQGDPRLAAIPVLMVTAGDVAAQRGPFRAPKVQAVAVTKSGGLQTQEWLHCVKALIDAVEPRYISPPGKPG